MSMMLTGCAEGTSAEELTKEYAEKAAKEAAEAAAEEAASRINKAIDENETASKIRDGAETAGEYAQDAYDYATDEKTISGAKQNAKELKDESVNFFDYMINKIVVRWQQTIDALTNGSYSTATGNSPADTLVNLENASEYDFLGDYSNPFKEAKGIDTSSDGTAMYQLKVAYEEFTKSAQKIKKNHDEKHPKDAKESGIGETPAASSETSESKAETSAADGRTYTQKISDLLYPEIPAYKGNPFCIVNKNIPFFNPEDLNTEVFETYSELDSLGRCGVAYANICKDIMPTEERGSIGNIKPTGFVQKKYECLKTEDNPGQFLWARCHLIGYQLAAENDNPKNLITGTFYFNVDGMEPFENAVAQYVRKTNRHVLYRVTPIYNGNNLVASGVLMEARSVEDDEICFCVYVYNVAPGVNIDYATGNSSPVG